ncbi:MAG: AbrB/MazE/SpoVT family DNA-binding domain-containing protein [Planctomycetaceae bacterium]|nr:AbrB/MazE/SpoVT family DNA-binding domain-containing protein [Planctomycetaceae bacterium]
MARSKITACCKPEPDPSGGYRVESIITVDERGQMVLPKSIREKAQIAAGDRLALITWAKDDRVCCLSLIKVEELSEMVGGFLSSLTVASQSDS